MPAWSWPCSVSSSISAPALRATVTASSLFPFVDVVMVPPGCFHPGDGPLWFVAALHSRLAIGWRWSPYGACGPLLRAPVPPLPGFSWRQQWAYQRNHPRVQRRPPQGDPRLVAMLSLNRSNVGRAVFLAARGPEATRTRHSIDRKSTRL